LVTHNAAVIGVTGSGKSFLAFHLIESIVAAGIKVLILDVSRQHDIYLTGLGPTALRRADEVQGWLRSDSAVGIHQFGGPMDSLPAVTADFVAAAFGEVSTATLERGRNIPARLCIVFEEAHSLIPEWNQVAQPSDTQQVNRTARVLLQGRKYGMGALVITQRTANVTKTILNQCNTIFALQSFDQTGLDFLRNYMGEEYSQAISSLPARHAILVGMASSSTRPLLMRVLDLSTRWAAAPTAPTPTT
jgi:DNA helicase HerA-like ATPase